jgi:hypothetical protein
MTRVVGTRNRSPFILDPVEAMKEGARVDAMGGRGDDDPDIRGVLRATHSERNALDWARMVRAAAKVQAARRG